MNTRHCVNFASQSSISSDTLAFLCLRNNASTSTSIYHRLATCIAVICWLVLGYHLPDDYTGKGRAVHRNNRNSFGKRDAAGVNHYQPRANTVPFPKTNGKPQIIEDGVKSKRITRCQIKNF